MTIVMMVFFLLTGAELQALMPGFACLAQVKFPVLLALVLYYALHRDTAVMLLAAILGGCLQDVMSPIPLGCSPMAFGLIGWLSGRFRSLVIIDSPVTPVFFGGAASACVTAVLLLLLARIGLLHMGLGTALMKIAGAAVAGMVCAPFVFLVAHRCEKLVGNVEVKEEVSDIEWYVGE